MKYYLNLSFFISIIIVPEIGTAQLVGDYNLVGITKESHYIARELSSGETGNFDLTASWPSSENPVYIYTLSTYSVGDTIGTLLVPLMSQTSLDSIGVSLNIDVNDIGNFIINGNYPAF